MASNLDKFIDRNPTILAAGKISDNLGTSVANCLKEYTIDDATAALRSVANIDENAKTLKYKTEPYKNKIRKGIYTEIQPILRPQVETRYETLINELKETTYESHWNKAVGKGRDPTPGLPKGFNPFEVAFGNKSEKDESVKELINPSKNVYQVLSESQIGHELYRKTHDDYNPGERICRNYLSPPFNGTKRFGQRSKYDPRGIWVKCACTWHQNESTVYTNQVQANFLNKTRNQLGKALTPNDIAETLPKNFVYGKFPKRDLYSVEDLLKDGDCPKCDFKRDLKSWLSSFNKLKIHMKKRFSSEFTINDLKKILLYHDAQECGVLPLDVFYEVCARCKFKFDENIEPFLRFLSVVCEDKIDYGRFLEIIDSIELMKIHDIPERNLYYLTTYQAANCDYLLINNAETPTAGVPSMRYDLPRPVVPYGGCRADTENLGDECSAATLLNPSIFINYGLSFRDFFIPRDKSVTRSLFEKIGYKFSDKTFEEFWKKAIELSKANFVCVDSFYIVLLKHYSEQKHLVVDEATC